jgi:HAMP domain-containing protein
MLNNLKLGAKFNLVLLLIFILGVAISGTALSQILQRNAQNEVTSKALVLLETMNSIRNYTNKEVNPELATRLETEAQFLPQTVPAYSARQVFEHLRSNKKEYNNFFYKEATLNPTNPRDKADEFETAIVEKFRDKTLVGETRGFRSTPGGELFYVARPLAISQESCLRCHSTPERAPKSQIQTYGNKTGFGWQLNEIVAAQIISVPANDIFQAARDVSALIIGIFALMFGLAILLVNILLKKSVIQPLTKISQTAKDVSTGNLEAEFQHNSQDEIGLLATAFNRMKVSLKMAMDMLDRDS